MWIRKKLVGCQNPLPFLKFQLTNCVQFFIFNDLFYLFRCLIFSLIQLRWNALTETTSIIFVLSMKWPDTSLSQWKKNRLWLPFNRIIKETTSQKPLTYDLKSESSFYFGRLAFLLGTILSQNEQFWRSCSVHLFAFVSVWSECCDWQFKHVHLLMIPTLKNWLSFWCDNLRDFRQFPLNHYCFFFFFHFTATR